MLNLSNAVSMFGEGIAALCVSSKNSLSGSQWPVPFSASELHLVLVEVSTLNKGYYKGYTIGV